MIASITEEDFCEALRVFLVAVAPAGVSVTQGQVNRVAEPLGDTFLVFWPSLRTRMATTVETWGKVAATAVTNSASTNFQAQVDLHGPGASDIAQNVATLLRSQWGVEQFNGTNIVPLFSTDGSQAPFVNGESQYENRWTMTIALGASPSVSTAQDFADTLKIDYSPTGGIFS
jgi:hypothetical protein